MSIVDLHMHSKYSLDGEYSSEQLVKQCKKVGLKIMSIADHNTVEAIEEAEYYAKALDIELISGIEIDCCYKDINFHLLGYGINYKAKDFENLTNEYYKEERSASRLRVEKIKKLGFDLSLEELIEIKGSNIIAPEDIADFLLHSAYAVNNSVLEPYLIGGSRSDNPNVNFYWDYFSKGKICNCDTKIISINEAIEIIVKNGGIPVIAHPGMNFKDNYCKLEELFLLGVKGIECFSSYHDMNQCEFFYKMAKEKNLIVTAGSDFHGKNKPSVKLGKTNCFLDDKSLLLEIEKLGTVQ